MYELEEHDPALIHEFVKYLYISNYNDQKPGTGPPFGNRPSPSKAGPSVSQDDEDPKFPVFVQTGNKKSSAQVLLDLANSDGSKSPLPKPSSLLFNTKMYLLADFLLLPELKELATKKYQKAVSRVWIALSFLSL